MEEIGKQEAIQAVWELIKRIEKEKENCSDEIRMKELGCLMDMYRKEIEVLVGEADETYLSVLDKVQKLYIPFLNGIIDSVVNYKIKLNKEGYPNRMSKSVALSVLNDLRDDELWKMYKQEDYILTFINSQSALYESVLDKVNQLYAPLIKDEFLKECSAENLPAK